MITKSHRVCIVCFFNKTIKYTFRIKRKVVIWWPSWSQHKNEPGHGLAEFTPPPYTLYFPSL